MRLPTELKILSRTYNISNNFTYLFCNAIDHIKYIMIKINVDSIIYLYVKSDNTYFTSIAKVGKIIKNTFRYFYIENISIINLLSRAYITTVSR